MRALNIQIQSQLEPAMDAARARAILEDLARLSPLVDSFTCNEGDDGSGFIVFTFESDKLAALWNVMQERLFSDASLGEHLKNCATTIATRGDAGAEGAWQNYVLLQHFDPFTPVESLDS